MSLIQIVHDARARISPGQEPKLGLPGCSAAVPVRLLGRRDGAEKTQGRILADVAPHSSMQLVHTHETLFIRCTAIGNETADEMIPRN